MLSVGDSLMWGQGLLPEHRFREIVRARLGDDAGVPVVELSMARSGAKVHPLNSPGTDDADDFVSDSLDNPPVAALYAAGNFAREVPNRAPTTFQQLVDAQRVLEDDSGGDPAEIRFILLDGGINDVGIFGILAPLAAIEDGYVLSTWNAWLRDQARIIEDEMAITLRTALDLYPNATVVVNGYFPIFSYHSVGNIVRMQSVGLLHGLANLVLATPFGLDALATASATWQAASNKHLRRAIGAVRRERPGRTVLFARSNIEGAHCLFAPLSWLWGYDAIPDDVPQSVDHWAQWLAGATPEDEVIPQRIARCRELVTDPTVAVPCRLASIGHPNLAGAQDYAQSIIGVLEDGGAIRSNLSRCAQGARRRRRRCTRFSDEWAYGCVSADAAIGEACQGGMMALAGAIAGQFSNAGERLGQAGDHLRRAGECYDDTGDDLRACDDTQAAEVAACNAAHTGRVNGSCNITCTRFTNCNSFGRFDPRRYACRAARAACVAAAAVARAACITGSVAIREACKAAAWAKSAACKAAVVAGDTACAAGQVAGAVVDGVIAAGHAVAGTLLAGAIVVTFVGCKVGGWVVNRGCRLGNWLAGGLCRVGATVIDGACWVAAAAAGAFRATRRLAGRGQAALDG